ncbi:MAG: hypothetical protein N3F09_09210 [Bacteroidia bacterium]|nr:hypothetical protein [Bacteroidia bacterium]
MSFFLSCKKKKSAPPPDPVPVIELVSITPTSVIQFKDSIIIVIKYKDNNGDLGEYSPEDHPLHVKDARLTQPDTYHVKPLAPPSDKDIPIEGNLSIRINNLFLLGSGNSEVTHFKIKLRDRAGNWSNEINTPQVIIHKQ